MTLAPIALFVYNRPHHARRTVEALLGNELAGESDLFVFCDGAKGAHARSSVEEVRRYVRSIDGFRSVTLKERASNVGLARSITEGVSYVCEQHGRVIVVEDDLVTSRWFLSYMNQALQVYENDEDVASIHGYCYPVPEELPETFFMRGADCWGWATWARSWRHFEPDGEKLLRGLRERKLLRAFDLDGAYPFSRMLAGQVAGRNDSWAVRWHAACFLNEKLTLYPGRSLVTNIGTDASGTHSTRTEEYEGAMAQHPVCVERIPLVPSEAGREAFAKFLRRTSSGLVRRSLSRIAKQLRVPPARRSPGST